MKEIFYIRSLGVQSGNEIGQMYSLSMFPMRSADCCARK